MARLFFEGGSFFDPLFDGFSIISLHF